MSTELLALIYILFVVILIFLYIIFKIIPVIKSRNKMNRMKKYKKQYHSSKNIYFRNSPEHIDLSNNYIESLWDEIKKS